MSNSYKLRKGEEEVHAVNLHIAVMVVLGDPECQLVNAAGKVVFGSGATYPFSNRRRGGIPWANRTEVQA